MRSPVWLVLALSGIMALSGCGDPDAPDKSGKKSASSGREDVALKIAHAAESSGDLSTAERMYQQAAEISKNSTEARLELAEFYKRHHQERQAITILKEILKTEPANTDVQRELANTYISTGAIGKALTLIDSAIAANGKDAMLYNSRGVALDMDGKYAEAQKSYHEALMLDPDDAATFKSNLSMSYILSNSYNKAIALLLPLMGTPDATPTVRQNLALAYGLKGESDKALKLGLKDLSDKEAQDNLKFYRMFSGPQADNKKVSTVITPSIINEVFPETPPPEATADVPIHDTVNPGTQETAAPVKPVAIKEVTTTVTEAVKPPHRAKPVVVEPDDEDEPIAVVAAKPVQPPKPAVKVAAKKQAPEEKPEENDSEESTAAIAAEAPAAGQFVLPSPTLKPDATQ